MLTINYLFLLTFLFLNDPSLNSLLHQLLQDIDNQPQLFYLKSCLSALPKLTHLSFLYSVLHIYDSLKVEFSFPARENLGEDYLRYSVRDGWGRHM